MARASIGDPIYQPGVYDGGGMEQVIAYLERFVPIYLLSTGTFFERPEYGSYLPILCGYSVLITRSDWKKSMLPAALLIVR